MLTHSHSELENIINSDNSGLKSELELKEQNNNELLKELQIKDLHIKSLEKLLMQSNPMDIIDKNKNDNFNMTFSHNLDKKDNNIINIENINNNINKELITSTSTFQKDDEREKELNKLMNNMKSKDKENFYDKEMNEELRQLAKETNKFDGDNFYEAVDNNINNLILNKSLRNQIMENKSDEIKMMKNIGNNSGKNSGNKIIGKIFNVNKK